MLIGVVGARGDVGLATVQALLALGLQHLRLGGRDAMAGSRCLTELHHQWPAAHLQWQTVDFEDASSLARFAQGCEVLVNCAGPAWRLAGRCAQAAMDAMAHFVDAADTLHPPAPGPGRCMVLGAGLQPGLTGLLPRWLAERGFTQVHALTSYFGLRDHFTLVAADDFLQGATDGSSEPLAAWRNGRSPRALARRREARLPCFQGAVQVLPYLNHEGERLARQLGLADGQWFSVIEDGHVLKALDLAHGQPRAEAAQRLRQASLLDLGGQAPFVTLLVQLDGHLQGQPITRSVLLGGAGNAALTGAMAAASTLSVVRNELPAGRHHAAQVLPAALTLERLQRTSAIRALTCIDLPIDHLHHAEEGSL